MIDNTNHLEQGRAVFVTVLMILSVIAVSITFAGGAAAQTGELTDRSVPETAEPGETVEIVTEVEINADTEFFVLSDEFDPEVDDVELGAEGYTVDGEPRLPDLADDATDSSVSVFKDSEDTIIEGGSTVEVAYEITIPDEPELNIYGAVEVQETGAGEAETVSEYEDTIDIDDPSDDGGGSSDDSGGGGGGGGGGLPADYRIPSLDSGATQETVETGEDLDIVLQLANDGDEAGNENVTIKANDEEIESTSIRVLSGQRVESEFTHVFTEPGEYEIAAEGETFDEEAIDTVTVTGDPLEDPDDGAGSTEDATRDDSDDGVEDSDTIPGFTAVLTVIALLTVVAAVRIQKGRGL